MNLRWSRVEKKGAAAFTTSTPNGVVTVRQKAGSVTWQAMLGNMQIATGYTSTECQQNAERKIEAMGRKRA